MFWNTTDIHKVSIISSKNNLVKDFPTKIDPLIPNQESNLKIELSKNINVKFQLKINITSNYASDLQLEIEVDPKIFESSIFGFESICVLIIIISLGIHKKRGSKRRDFNQSQ